MASQLTVCLLYSPSTNTVSNTQVLKTFDTGVEQTHLIIHKERTHVNSVSNVARLNYLRLIGLQKLCFNVRPNYPNAKLCLFLSLSINQYYCSLMWPLHLVGFSASLVTDTVSIKRRIAHEVIYDMYMSYI